MRDARAVAVPHRGGHLSDDARRHAFGHPRRARGVVLEDVVEELAAAVDVGHQVQPLALLVHRAQPHHVGGRSALAHHPREHRRLVPLLLAVLHRLDGALRPAGTVGREAHDAEGAAAGSDPTR